MVTCGKYDCVTFRQKNDYWNQDTNYIVIFQEREMTNVFLPTTTFKYSYRISSFWPFQWQQYQQQRSQQQQPQYRTPVWCLLFFLKIALALKQQKNSSSCCAQLVFSCILSLIAYHVSFIYYAYIILYLANVIV